MFVDIKSKIQAGEINEAMIMAITEAMKLEIITSISNSDQQSSSPYIRTFIDLLENEIEYQISEELIDDNHYHQIKEIHHEQMLKGNEIILNNIKSIQKMFSILNETSSGDEKS